MLPLFNNAIYASAAINNYNNVADAAAQVLYDDRERAAAASQKKRRCGARLARSLLACRWIYLSIFVRGRHNSAGCGANYITDLLTAGRVAMVTGARPETDSRGRPIRKHDKQCPNVIQIQRL